MTRWACRCIPPGYALVLAMLVTAPVLRPGYLLLRDAVSTPRSFLSDAALGLGESAPRAVPQDFAVAVASQFVDGGVVVKALLVAGLWLAGWGAARLVAVVLPDAGLAGQFVAITVAIWNPYVGERLLQGHWSLLVGYGCLAWVAATMTELRTTPDAGRSGFAAVGFWIALAGLTPTGLLLAAAVALACVGIPGLGRPRWLCAAVALGCAVAAGLPWLTAAALGSPLAPAGGPALGVTQFAARAEPGLATVGSLAGLGGIWNAEAVPASRTTLFALLATIVLLGVIAAGLPALRRRPAAVVLVVLAVVSVAVPTALATGAGRAALVTLIDTAPGLGVLRDGQKWVALAAPGYALAGAGAVVTLRRLVPPLPAGAAGAVLCLALIAVLPDLAWGVGGRVTPVHYPPGWAVVAAAINDDPDPVAVLPVDSLRSFSWAGPAPVLDPLPRWVRAEVLSTGDLTISGHTILGEGARAREVHRLLVAGDPAALARAGVGWLVVESAAPPPAGLPMVYRDGDLGLYRVGGHAAGASPQRRRLATAAHLGWLATLMAGGAVMAVSAVRRGAGPTARR